MELVVQDFSQHTTTESPSSNHSWVAFISSATSTDTSFSSLGSPTAASSPKPGISSQPLEKNSLRVVNVNVQSVRNKGKYIDVRIESTTPDIIIGTETWLYDSMNLSEILHWRLGYSVFSRDRPSDPHGGVLKRPLRWSLNCREGQSWDDQHHQEQIHCDDLSHVTRKPIFWVFDQVRLKPVCSATETS